MEGIKSKFVSTKTFWLLLGVVFLSLILRDLPFFSFLFAPFNQFEVFLHEMSHALACVFTGGWVSGLTIVEDGNGHGGLTFTHGGIPFIYSQAGYIGETLWGCFLIALSRFPRLSRYTLVAIGIAVGLVSIYFMPGGILMPGYFFQALGSLIWGLAMAAGLVWIGLKLSDRYAHPVLLFIAVQSCLSSLQGVWVLFLQSLGAFPGTWSDATNMANMTNIPAVFWGLSWSFFSIAMLSWTLWMSYKADARLNNPGKAVSAASALASGSSQSTNNKAIEAKHQIEQELANLHIEVEQGEKLKIKRQERKGG